MNSILRTVVNEIGMVGFSKLSIKFLYYIRNAFLKSVNTYLKNVSCISGVTSFGFIVQMAFNVFTLSPFTRIGTVTKYECLLITSITFCCLENSAESPCFSVISIRVPVKESWLSSISYAEELDSVF